jgi:hypothetical protein
MNADDAKADIEKIGTGATVLANMDLGCTVLCWMKKVSPDVFCETQCIKAYTDKSTP